MCCFPPFLYQSSGPPSKVATSLAVNVCEFDDVVGRPSRLRLFALENWSTHYCHSVQIVTPQIQLA